jgi:oligoribonuclease
VNIFWVDLETTGLKPIEGHILECAVIVTDPWLEPLAEFSFLVRPPRLEQVIENLSDYVYKMHETSGLLVDLLDPSQQGIEAHELSGVLTEIITSTGCSGLVANEPYRAPMGGYSVHFDRKWLEHFAPAATALLSHRNIDVSTITELAQRWFTTQHDPGNAAKHRALDDVRHSIERLKWYRSHLFNPHGRKARPQ